MPGPEHENFFHNANQRGHLVSVSCFSLEHDLAPGCSRGQVGSRGRVRSLLPSLWRHCRASCVEHSGKKIGGRDRTAPWVNMDAETSHLLSSGLSALSGWGGER